MPEADDFLATVLFLGSIFMLTCRLGEKRPEIVSSCSMACLSFASVVYCSLGER